MISQSKPTLSDLEAVAAAKVISSGQLAEGIHVQRFEEEMAD